MNEIILATKNTGKMKEFKSFFSRFGIQCLSLEELDQNYPDVKETGLTFTENAQLKAEAGSSFFNKAVIADDSGLVIDKLDGRPGIYSARYAGPNKNDDDNMDQVLHELKGVIEKERTARFVAALAIATPDEETIIREGFCEGHIAFKKSGSSGFGYDPIFIPKGHHVTMAELSSEEKNRMSHRSHAFKQLEKWFGK